MDAESDRLTYLAGSVPGQLLRSFDDVFDIFVQQGKERKFDTSNSFYYVALTYFCKVGFCHKYTQNINTLLYIPHSQFSHTKPSPKIHYDYQKQHGDKTK